MASERRRGWLIAAVMLAACSQRDASDSDGSAHGAGASGAEQSSADAAPPRECAAGAESCMRHGRPGTCVRGRCVLGVGACAVDIDCDDFNACTHDPCEAGVCRNRAVANEANAPCPGEGDAPGVCRFGACVPVEPRGCEAAKDCPSTGPGCHDWRCVTGRCALAARSESAPCETAAGGPGSCAGGVCILDADAARSPAKRCRTRWDPYFGYVERCRQGLAYELSPEALRKAEHDLEAKIDDVLRYDMKAAFVRLADGGYNLALFNRRGRDEVRGLCDPSLVAFTVAGYTGGTQWKSRNLLVWVDPYREGWGLPTKGSRKAVRKGMARSRLGFLGVVDVKGFRMWLERTFRSLKPSAEPPKAQPLDPSAFPDPAALSPPPAVGVTPVNCSQAQDIPACIAAHEQARIDEHAGDVVREGAVLKLKLRDGSWAEREDTGLDKPNGKRFVFERRLATPDAWLIAVEYYEEGDFELVVRSSGEGVRVPQPPVVAPDDRRFAVVSGGIEYGSAPNVVEVWRIDGDQLFQEWTLPVPRWDPERAWWLGPDRLAVRGSAVVDASQDPARSLVTTLTADGWRVARTAP